MRRTVAVLCVFATIALLGLASAGISADRGWSHSLKSLRKSTEKRPDYYSYSQELRRFATLCKVGRFA
jgi:hypothetical protein